MGSSDMYQQTYLHKRKEANTYYFRMRIPSDIEWYLGKKEIKRSLRTSDPRQAKRLALEMALKQGEACWQQISANSDKSVPRIRVTNTLIIPGPNPFMKPVPLEEWERWFSPYRCL